MSANPGSYGNDFSNPELAITKAEHDRMMKNRKRPLTDGPMKRRKHARESPISKDEELAGAAANARKVVES